MTTIKDVAKLANVSIATVSKAFNNKYGVSEETRKKVLMSANKLGYTPNYSARQLATHNSYCIGIIFPYCNDNLEPNFFVSQVMEGIEKTAKTDNYNIMISGCDIYENKLPLMIESRQVDGVCVVGGIFKDEFLEKLIEQNIPIVSVGTFSYKYNINTVLSNDQKGVFQAISYLIEMGHKNIGFINVPKISKTYISKLSGFHEAMGTYGIKVNENLLLCGDFSKESGYKMTEKLIKSDKEITAIFYSR